MTGKWLKFFSRIARSSFGSLRYPYKLFFVVTKACHSRCVNCSIWKLKPENELTLDEIRAFAERNPYFSWIDFTGGEVTDRKDFAELVDAFVKSQPDLLLVHFPTNGLKPKRTEDLCRELVARKTPNLTVTVSIDGPESVNDELRGIPGDFRKAVETYKRIREIKGISTYVGMTLYERNSHLIVETLEALKKEIPDFRANNLHVNIPHTSGHYYDNSETNPKATLQMLDELEKFKNMKERTFTPFEIIDGIYQGSIREYLESGVSPVDCAALMSSCYLSEMGLLYPCTIWDAPLGNIRDSDYRIEEMLHSEKARNLREALLKKQCPNCWTPCEAYQSIFANLGKRSVIKKAFQAICGAARGSVK